MGPSYFLFSVVLLTLIQHYNAFSIPCDESVSSLKAVDECPTDRRSFERAAEKKNCSSMSNSCQSFQYHCVLNENLTGLVEVCTSSLFIMGSVCPRFDISLKSIIRIDDVSCFNFSSPCPNRYNSTDTYKYPGCFQVINQVPSSTETLTSAPGINAENRDDADNNSGSVIAGIVVGVFVAILLLGVVVISLRKKRKFCFKNNDPEIEMNMDELPDLSDMRPNVPPDSPALENEPLLPNDGQQNGGIVRENRADDPEIENNMDILPTGNGNDMRPNVPPDSPALENEPLLPNDGQQNGGIVRENRADAPETEMDEVHDIVPPGNDNENGNGEMIPNVVLLNHGQTQEEINGKSTPEAEHLLNVEQIEDDGESSQNEETSVKQLQEGEQVTKEINEDVMDAFQSKQNQYPAYKGVKTRLLSFEGCNDNFGRRRKEFAGSGFYYEGYDLKTTCFHCGATKSDWKDSDDILEAHLTLNGDCEYLNYVQSHITNT